MRIMLRWTLAVLLMLGAAMPAVAAGPRFARGPVASREGDKWKIEFTVNQKTDVAVAIEDAAGRVVRHLAAGVPQGATCLDCRSRFNSPSR